MKKLIALTLSLLLLAGVFTACAKNGREQADVTTADNATSAQPDEKAPELSKEPVRIYTLKGPTGMGMAPLMEKAEKGEAALNYSFNVAAGADAFKGEIIQGNFEIACVPTNLAAVLYAKTNGAVSIAAVNTLGVLYLLENGETVNNIEDLQGKTVYSSGQGAVPEYALNYILDAFDIDCEVIYEAEHDLVVTDLVSGKASIGILPEPKVTAALKNANAPEGLRCALDLNKLWEEACLKNGDDSAFYMGCIIVNNTWAKDNKNELKAFLEEYKSSVDTVNSDPDTASELIAKFEIVPAAPIAKASLPTSNIVFITGEEMEKGLSGFFKVLHGYNPQSVGGKIPDDGIFLSVN